MTDFRTELVLSPSETRIALTDSLLTVGSCFSDAIGSRLISNKISALVNPFGVIYNPYSIHKVMQYAVSNHIVSENSFLQRDDVVLHYDFHSNLSSLEKNYLQKKLQSVIGAAHNFVGTAGWLIVTYGTAWVYEHLESGDIVANCHKMPQALFKRFLLTEKRILDSFEAMYAELKLLNPNIEVILTVSPVRHMKETLEFNSVSKSVLRLACHTLTQQHKDVHYFPAYEILIDDLRDYRFYKSDLIHPSDAAEEYIWEKFSEQYFSEELKTFLSRWKDIRSALTHRPFHPGSAGHRRFVAETIKKLEELKGVVNVEEEIALLKKQQTA